MIIQMNKPYKNQLQEYYQKLQQPLPQYTTIKTSYGLWQSTVSTACNHSFQSLCFANKKDAENNAAELAYNFLLSNVITQTITSTKIFSITQKVPTLMDIDMTNYHKILLVDGENCDIDLGIVLTNVLVLIFVSKNTTKKSVFQSQNNYDNCFVFISNSVGRDAADHLLTFYAGKLSIIQPLKEYYVLTKDHYGEFLESFMNNCKFICAIYEVQGLC